ncbi:MAG: hypothetical protein EOO27_46540 [Comamonadaceae bacterium]|nr:MAG: hypothetical protein EOO27_46540 [Comamonadaceae bacterium]
MLDSACPRTGVKARFAREGGRTGPLAPTERAPAVDQRLARAQWSVQVAGAIGGVVLLPGVHAATTRHNMTQWDTEWNEIDKPRGRQVS